MTMDQVLNLDYTEKESRITIQKALRKMKPLAKYEEGKQIPIEAIEKMVSVLVNKYMITPQWISHTFKGLRDGVSVIYSCGVKSTDTHEWLGTVSGHTIYEFMAKLVIKLFIEVKKGTVPQQEETNVEKERREKAEEISDENDEEWE